MEIKGGEYHHDLAKEHQQTEETGENLQIFPKWSPPVLRRDGRRLLAGHSKLLQHEEIVPGEEEGVARGIEASPGVSGLVAISLGQVVGDGADTCGGH